MNEGQYEVIHFDEDTKCYVVKHKKNGVIETLQVAPSINTETNEIDVPATEHLIREAVKKAQMDKVIPTNVDVLIGKLGTASEETKEI